jgi:protein phosphatase
MHFSMAEANDAVYTIAEANGAVHSAQEENSPQMGTTCVAAFVTEKESFVINVGDSRAYMIEPDSITQLSIDHTLVQLWYLMGKITKEEMLTHESKNLLMRTLGWEKNVDADFTEVATGSVLLLCSDGLTNSVNNDIIQKTVLENDIEEASDILISLALQNGGKDNITVILVSK